MVYQGSKNRLAKYLVPIIQDYIDNYLFDTYIEFFVGGANLIDKIQCNKRIGYDINENVINLLNYAKIDPDLSIAPEDCSFEHYADVRANQHTGKYSPEYVALIGYMASYGGRYFDGGYGRDSKGERSTYRERLKNLRNQASKLKGIEFSCMDYATADISKYKNCLIYLDPPYRSTKPYAKQKMDYDYFYDFCRKLSSDNKVFISEYNMPDDFKCIWERERKVLQKVG